MFGHLGLALISLYGLYYSSGYLLFWILGALLFFSSEPRFSLEYYFWTAGLLGLALSPLWRNKARANQELVLCLAFIVFALSDFSKICFSERGSLLIWLPVFLATLSPQNLPQRFLREGLSALVCFYSNKTSLLLAYLSYLWGTFSRTYKLLGLGLLAILSSLLIYFSKQGLSKFIAKSVHARLEIWQACWQAFMDRPFFGHGFGTFAIDFPVYRAHADIFGARTSEHISHAHSSVLHFMFEQGLLGLGIFLFIAYWIYRKSPLAIYPLLIISVCDASLVNFNQYLLLALILSPSQKPKSPVSFLKIFRGLALSLALFVNVLSWTAHYYYARNDFSSAIKLDPYHSLYHFMQGATLLHVSTKLSEQDLKRAVELSPNVSYFYTFLAAAYLANCQDLSPHSQDPRLKLASAAIQKALRYDGGDAYIHILSSFIHYQQPKLSQEERSIAFKLNPEIRDLLHKPELSSSKHIGNKKSDVRISDFYRQGARVHLPLPYLQT